MLKKTHIISGLLITPLTLYAATSYQVDDIRFEGLQRVTVGAALLSMPLHAGEAVTAEEVSEAVRAVCERQFRECADPARWENAGGAG